jgi:hypothetical protein
MVAVNYFYSFVETSIGVFKLENISANLNLDYILTSDNGCGSSTLVQKGQLTSKTVIVTNSVNNEVTFSNLPDGIYYLRVKHVGQSYYPTIQINNFANLELSILQDVKGVFGNCTDCSDPANLCCLLNKMNYYFFLKGGTNNSLVKNANQNLFDSYKCSMIGNIDCTLNNELFYGKCKTDLRYIISFFYLWMYNSRVLVDKITVYDYTRIYKYISTKIVNLQ